MITRAQLEEILAAHRARTLRVRPPAIRKRCSDLADELAVIAILVASGAAMFFAVQLTTPKASAATMISPSTSPSTYTTLSSTTAPATPVARQVRTDIPEGRLNMRFAAGDGTEGRGDLAEGGAILIALGFDDEMDSHKAQGHLWLCLLSPIGVGSMPAIYANWSCRVS